MVLINFAILLGVLTTLTTASLEPSNVSVQLITSAEMNKMLQEYPNAQQLSVQIPDEKLLQGATELGQGRYNRVYTIGNRVNGDRLVSIDQNSYSWPLPQDVTFTQKYPANGVGALVTYYQINVFQSSAVGRAYVMAGGIGQRTITIVVEAKNTYYFNYNSSVYGIN